MISPRWVALIGLEVLLAAADASFSQSQDPAVQAPQTAPSAKTSTSATTRTQKHGHANDFLIIGTVFDSKGYAFPGVQLRIRRSTEKKFRWDDATNSRGEFAIRVPQGSQYEMVVHRKGFADQTRELDAKTGLGEARIVFRMEAEGEKR
jgi:carboxypeptidase family protein